MASAYRAPPLHLRLWSRLCLIADSLELRPVALAAAAEPHLVNQENPAEYNAVVRAVMDVTKKPAQKLDAKGSTRSKITPHVGCIQITDR